MVWMHFLCVLAGRCCNSVHSHATLSAHTHTLYCSFTAFEYALGDKETTSHSDTKTQHELQQVASHTLEKVEETHVDSVVGASASASSTKESEGDGEHAGLTKSELRKIRRYESGRVCCFVCV